MDTASVLYQKISRTRGLLILEGIANLLGEPAPLRNIKAESEELIIVGPSYEFDDLPIDKKRLQSQISENYRHFIALVWALLRTQPAVVHSTIEQDNNIIREIIEQTNLVYYSTTEEAVTEAKKAISEILDSISCLYDPTEGSVILVPDTNALIYSPAFQSWKFNKIPKFEILLVSTLLMELDKLKIEHRNPEVRRKAQDVIRQIKEYRSRGSLNDGVVVVNNHIWLRTCAVEPQVDKILPWFDSTTRDDRMLASCVEAMRAHPRSVVALVTGDINLQNKAEFALVPYVEPPNDFVKENY